jgi:hypothetical protein
VHELSDRRFRNCFKNTIKSRFSRTLIVQKEQQTILQPSNHYIHNNTRVTFYAFMHDRKHGSHKIFQSVFTFAP